MSSSVVSITDPSKWAQPPRRISFRSSKSAQRRSRSANKKGRSLSPSNKQSAKSASKNKPIKRTRSLGRLKMISLPIKPVIKRFISFGCWNRFVDPNSTSKKGFGFQKVLPEIQTHIDTPGYKTDFVLISGDNYYPTKDKDPAGEKRKMVNADQLQAGFSMLPKNTDVHLILGNHDIETNPSIGQGNIVDSNTQGQTTKCKISELEKSALHPEVGLKDAPKIHIFHAFMWTPNTAIIMFDTSLYDNLDEDTVDCYDKFEPLNGVFPIEDKRQKRIKEQEDYIMDFLKTHRTQPIQNVVLMGHYPIVSIKMKEAKEKDKKKSEEESTKDKPKMKEKVECCLFTHLFTNIYNMFDQSKQPRYHYLCADVHMYQKVIVNIPIVPKPEKTLSGEIETLDESLDESPVESLKTMEIIQYVVGTGGAELDDPPKLNPRYSTNQIKPKTIKIPNTEQIVEFNVEQAQKTNGFLECVLYPEDPELYFGFHFIKKI